MIYKIISVSLVLAFGFLNCAGYHEEGSHEYVTTFESLPCPDRAQFESDFQYNLSLTQDIAEQCKIKDVNRSQLVITLRKVRKSEIQTGAVNE